VFVATNFGVTSQTYNLSSTTGSCPPPQYIGQGDFPSIRTLLKPSKSLPRSPSRPLHEAAESFLSQIRKQDGHPIEIAFYESDGKKGKPGQMALGHGGEQADNTGSMSKEGNSMVYIAATEETAAQNNPMMEA
jgi:hypothetical protein